MKSNTVFIVDQIGDPVFYDSVQMPHYFFPEDVIDTLENFDKYCENIRLLCCKSCGKFIYFETKIKRFVEGFHVLPLHRSENPAKRKFPSYGLCRGKKILDDPIDDDIKIDLLKQALHYLDEWSEKNIVDEYGERTARILELVKARKEAYTKELFKK